MSATTKSLSKPEQLALAKLFNDKDQSNIRRGVVVAAGGKAKTIPISCLVRLDGELTVSPDTEATVGPRICPWRMIEALLEGDTTFEEAVKLSAIGVKLQLKTEETEALKVKAQAEADQYFKNTIKVPRCGAVVFAGVVSKLGK